jgi:Ca2+-binding EF-hand superfamily protein
LQTAFDSFDLDGSGYISSDELKEVLSFGEYMDQKKVI